jgi:protein TonB
LFAACGRISYHPSEWIAKRANRRHDLAETTMTAFTHLLNIGTLAAWLSVAGFGTVAVVYPGTPVRMPVMVVGETMLLPDDFELGGETSEEPSEETPDTVSPAIAQPLPAPPDLPEIAETKPLPKVPAFPAITENPAPVAKPTRKPSSEAPRQASREASHSPGNGKPGSSASGGTASKTSTAARLAAGSMPAPSYPAEARRKGQTGTVVVQFTVDSRGRVTYANASSPSPWPLLNQEAVRTVLRWRFPPGDFISLERPIVFRLK